MGKFNHYSYLRGSGVIEITIRDERGAKLDSMRANIEDKKNLKNIARLLKDKYDIDLNPEIPIDKAPKGFFEE